MPLKPPTLYAQETPSPELPPMTQQENLNLNSLLSPIPCKQPDGCPWSEGVGIFGYTSFECVATYITFNEQPALLTAGHCLQGEKEGELIDGFFLLPTIVKENVRRNTEEVQLLRVERLFESDKDDLDVAIISLKHAPRFHRPRSISKKAFTFNSSYSFVGKNFDPKIKNNYWSLQENCYNSIENILVLTNNRPTMQFLKNCHVGLGNSGAPVFDEDGDLVGVMRGLIDPQDLLDLYRFIKENNFTKETKELEEISLAHAYAYFSLLNCLGDNLDTIDPNCNARQRQDQVRVVTLANATLYTPQAYIPIYNQLDVLVPHCIKATDIMTSKNGQNFIRLKIYYPEIDRNLNLKFGKKLESYKDAPLLDSESPNSYKVSFDVRDGEKNVRTLFAAQVPLCQ